MFKVVNEFRLVGTKVYCELYATTKEEVTEEATISGLPVGRELSSGSYGYTQAGDLFIYDEDEGFKFVGAEDPEPEPEPSVNSTRLLKSEVDGDTVEPVDEIPEEEEAEPEER